MDGQAEVLTFLQDCHKYLGTKFKHPERPLDTLPPYESRPYDWYDPDELEQAWFKYLNLKFSYLNMLDRAEALDEPEAEAARAEAGRVIGTKAANSEWGDLSGFLSDWKANAHDEQIAYVHRVLQLPEDRVHTEWYFQDIEPCREWCRVQQERLDGLELSIKKSIEDHKIPDIFNAEGPTRLAAIINEERRLDIITKIAIQGSANRILDIQKGWPPNVDGRSQNTNEYEQFRKNLEKSVINEVDLLRLNESCPFEHKFLLELYLDLTTALISQGFDETEVIRQFLYGVKKKFKCEICDYLDIDAHRTKLTWRVATLRFADLSEEYQKLYGKEENIKRRTQQNESYNKGQGITGSILLLDDAKGKDMWYHVGSNDVLHDPRQSEQHRSTYELDLYPNALKVSQKKIQNFWAFPIFVGTEGEEKLVGAFRVVNKLDDEEKHIVGWTYTARVQLSIIADWFSKFLEKIRPHVQTNEDFRAVLVREGQFTELIKRLELDWIEEKSRANLRSLIRHLSRDVGKKNEHRPVGCCIFIAKEGGGRAPLDAAGGRGLDRYPLIETVPGIITFPYDKLDNYHDAVNPLMGAFVFNHEGKFNRIVRLQKDDLSGIELIKKTTKDYPQSVCLLLMRGAKNVLIYKGGERAAEISISEGTGDWQFRYPDEIFEMMKERAPDVEERVLRIVLDACLEMSNKAFGGLFVLGNIPNVDTLFTFSNPKVGYDYGVVDVQSLDVDALVEFAKMDGATFIDADGKVRQINVTVRANEAKPESITDARLAPQNEHAERGAGQEALHEAQAGEDDNTQKRSNTFQGRGARHETGWIISQKAPEALVVIVSENRGISIVHGGGVVKQSL